MSDEQNTNLLTQFFLEYEIGEKVLSLVFLLLNTMSYATSGKKETP